MQTISRDGFEVLDLSSINVCSILTITSFNSLEDHISCLKDERNESKTLTHYRDDQYNMTLITAKTSTAPHKKVNPTPTNFIKDGRNSLIYRQFRRNAAFTFCSSTGEPEAKNYKNQLYFGTLNRRHFMLERIGSQLWA